MQRVRKLVAKVAPTHSTAIVLGETGTGKELVARSLHDQSARAEMQFVAINCGALPESLIESELFGHRRGAFTGADQNRVGLFEVADGGTLFLDEVGELPKAMQAKLLRVLESGEIRRVGENEAFKVDVRIVCATHRNLEQMVADGDFREDLMFRINTFEIRLPALRERVSDLPALARHLLKRHRPQLADDDPGFTPEALQTLAEHPWPGNVRELANAIEHATILCDSGVIDVEHLPGKFGALREKLPSGQDRAGEPARVGVRGDSPSDRPLGRQQSQSGRGTGHQPQDALQQAAPERSRSTKRADTRRLGANSRAPRSARSRLRGH